MQQSSITALVSAFARAYHSLNNRTKIFDDSMAAHILTDQEYQQISGHMVQGITFFNPGFKGSEQETLRWIVDNQLSPTPLGRAAYAESMLANAVLVGASQYLILGAGFDTFAYRQPYFAENLQIFEVDHPLTSADKQQRIQTLQKDPVPNLHLIEADFSESNWQNNLTAHPAFNREAISFCSILGLSYYLSKDDFRRLLCNLAAIVPYGSSIVFDYPDQDTFTDRAGDRAKKQVMMANLAKETMRAAYSYAEIEELLSEAGLLIYEHLEPHEITNRFFTDYNRHNATHPMSAFDNVNYCLGVKGAVKRAD
jgi:methyltransferase (TIGR00027 family)